MTKEPESEIEIKNHEFPLPQGEINIYKDYFGANIVGVQRGSDHQPLITISYPLVIKSVEARNGPQLEFEFYDFVTRPLEIRLKAVILYKAPLFVIEQYKKKCVDLFTQT